MAHLQFLWPSHKAIVLCIPPLLYFLGGVGGQLISTTKLSVSRSWSLARSASAAVLVFSFASCCRAVWEGTSLTGRPHLGSIFSLGRTKISFRFDLIESLMLLLVAFLGWVIVNYSQAYMAGDPRESAYNGRLMRTLAAVTLLVVTNSLVVFLIAWILTGLSLHGLLTLYPNRQAAVIAAHKKFLASRLADSTMLAGVLLLGSQTGSFELDRVVDYASKLHPVPLSISIAALLLAVSAIIKCAQLPVHGWLIQVMEAPTPVSALLHAGVVNLGGFMLIRLASVINTSQAAQALLVAVGCLTAVLASLVMTTRISIKVHLAWSTCAQMGFMIMECGLGLYALAFLHLLAHSLYKAYAFLGSGDTVNQATVKRMMPAIGAPKVSTLLASGLCGLVIAGFGEVLWRPAVRIDVSAVFCIMIVGLAVAGILVAGRAARGLAQSLLFAGTALAASAIYFGNDKLFQAIVPATMSSVVQHQSSLIFAFVCFALLYGIQTIVRADTVGSFATALYHWFYAGLYLDELFTRATFRLWPPRHRSKASRRRDVLEPFEGTGESL